MQLKICISLAGKQVIVLDAAVLLEAGWDSFVQEVWVVVVPRKEVKNIMLLF